MLRLTARNVLLVAAAASLSGNSPVAAQIFGRLPESRATPNSSCGLAECPPSVVGWGHYHENWRRWPEDPVTEQGERMLSPFTTPGMNATPDARVPDPRDEDAITPRNRAGSPAFSAPDAGMEADGSGAGSEPMPSPPSSASGSSLGGTSDASGDNERLDDSTSPFDDALPSDDASDSGEGLFPDFEPSNPDEPASQRDTEESELDDIFGDFGQSQPSRPRTRTHQMRRPSLTQRTIATRAFSTQPVQRPSQPQPTRSPWQGDPSTNNLPSTAAANDIGNTTKTASAVPAATRRSANTESVSRANPLRRQEAIEANEIVGAEPPASIQTANQLPNEAHNRPTEAHHLTPAITAQSAHAAALAASQRAYAQQMQAAFAQQQSAPPSVYGYPPYYTGVPMPPAGYPANHPGNFPGNLPGNYPGAPPAFAHTYAPEYAAQPATMQTAPMNNVGNLESSAYHGQVQVEPPMQNSIQPASAIVAIEDVSDGERRNPLRQ